MSKILGKNIFQALPPYMGGKRKLIPWIFQALSEICPTSIWENRIFIDAFTGGGSISLYAKAQGFKKVLSNDVSERSQLIIRGLLQNQSTYLTKEEALLLTQPLPNDEYPGFVLRNYLSSVFSSRHAKALDQILFWSHQFQSQQKQALGLLLAWHLVTGFVCMGTSIGSSNRPYAETLDGLRDWQELNPARFKDGSFSNLLQPSWKHLESKRNSINQGIFGGSLVQGFQMDAIDFVQQVEGDILYLDPPYPNCSSYESTNKVLDHLLTGMSNLEKRQSSSFTKSVHALEELLKVSHHIPIWILSYGNKALTLEELVELVKTIAPDRTVKGFSRAYKHLAHVSKTNTNQELLVIAYAAKETEKCQ